MGFGRMGYATAYDLVNSGYKVIVADVSLNALERAKKELGVDTYHIKDDFKWLSEFKGKVRVVASSLPWPIAFNGSKAVVEHGLNLTDVTSLSAQDPRIIDEIAKKNKVYAVLYAGVAPGMVQILSGAIYRELGGLDKLEIYCGGMPQDPTGKPLKTNITWSPIGYLGMYSRKSRKVVNGEIVWIDPLEDSGVIEFPGEGEYEYFLSDGLRSLLITFKDVPYMAEYSLRWKGHLEQIKLLRDLGLISKEPIKIGEIEIAPIEVTAKVIEKKLTADPRDKVLTMVRGTKGDKQVTYINATYYNEEKKLTAMQQTTGLTHSRLTMMALDGKLKEIREIGAIFPEEIGLNEKLFNEYLNEMSKVGITFTRIESTLK